MNEFSSTASDNSAFAILMKDYLKDITTKSAVATGQLSPYFVRNPVTK